MNNSLQRSLPRVLVIILTVALALIAAVQELRAQESKTSNAAQLMSPQEFVEGDYLELHLLGALIRGKDRKSISIYTRRWEHQRSGDWQYAIGFAGNFNSSYHIGRISHWEKKGDQIHLAVSMEVAPDAWVPGGRAHWEVKLSYHPETLTWSGSWKGRFQGQDLEGDAKATMIRMHDSNLVKGEELEHPRLLFRKRDLPALRAKWNTPFGKAAEKQMTNAAGLAFRYQMTGDKALAEEAMAKVKVIMADQSNGSKHIAHRVLGWRVEHVALAYDMCYEVWPESFKTEVRDYLRRVVERTYFDHGSWTEYAGWSMSHKFGANYLASASIGALVLYGEPGPALSKPAAYLGGQDPVLPIEAKITELTEDALVDDLKIGTMPKSWIGVTGIKQAEDAAKLSKSLSEFTDLVLTPNAPVHLATVGNFDFKQVPENGYWNGKLELMATTNKAFYSSQVFYALVKNDKERWVRFSDGVSGGLRNPAIWISGVPVNHDDVFKLGKGIHTIVFRVYMTETNPWGKLWIAPRFLDITEADAKEVIKHRLRDANERMADWQHADKLREQTGYDPRYTKLHDIGESLMAAMYRENMGGGGFTGGEKAMNFVMHSSMRYARMYQVMKGLQPEWYSDGESTWTEGMKYWAPVKLMSLVYDAEGKPIAQAINGQEAFTLNEWYEKRDVRAESFAALYPVTDPDMQPAVLHAWRHRFNIQNEETDAVRVLHPPLGKTRSTTDWGQLDNHAIMAFIAYPYEAQKTEFAEGLPKAWKASGWGWYVIRDRYQDADDFVVQFFAKTRIGDKFNRQNAGALRVMGLGHEWISGPSNNEVSRQTESTLFFPGLAEDPAIRWDAPAKVLFDEHGKDRGTVVLDMSDLLSKKHVTITKTKKGKRIRAQQIYTQYGNVELPGSYEPSKLKWRRSLGVDYSGKSGAACLIILRDEYMSEKVNLDSSSEAYWRLPVPEGGKIEGNSYTVQQGDATMRVTLISEHPLTLSTETLDELIKAKFKKSKNKDRTLKTHVLQVKGGKGDYLAVITIQKGEIPAVDGLLFSRMGFITVGKQKVTLGANLPGAVSGVDFSK